MIHQHNVDTNESGDFGTGYIDTLLALLDKPDDLSNVPLGSRTFCGPRDGVISEFSYAAYFVDVAFSRVEAMRRFKDMCELLLSDKTPYVLMY